MFWRLLAVLLGGVLFLVAIATERFLLQSPLPIATPTQSVDPYGLTNEQSSWAIAVLERGLGDDDWVELVVDADHKFFIRREAACYGVSQAGQKISIQFLPSKRRFYRLITQPSLDKSGKSVVTIEGMLAADGLELIKTLDKLLKMAGK